MIEAMDRAVAVPSGPRSTSVYRMSWPRSASRTRASPGSRPTPQMAQSAASPPVQQPVEVHGLVGAVEVTDADVDDAGPEIPGPVVRLRDKIHRSVLAQVSGAPMESSGAAVAARCASQKSRRSAMWPATAAGWRSMTMVTRPSGRERGPGAKQAARQVAAGDELGYGAADLARDLSRRGVRPAVVAEELARRPAGAGCRRSTAGPPGARRPRPGLAAGQPQANSYR